MTESPEINDFDDILKALEQNPRLRDAIRSYILSEDLLQLPALVRQNQEQIIALMEKQAELTERIAQTQSAFATAMTEIIQWQGRMEQRQDRMEQRQEHMEQRQEHMEQRLDRMEQRQERMEQRQDQMEQRQDRMEQRQERMEKDIADIKGHLVPLFITKVIMPGIANLTNTRRNRWLETTDIMDIADNAIDDPDIPTDDIPDGDIQSFYGIDLVMSARDKARPHPDNEVYVVIECSHTVHTDDLDRIRRNTDYMTRFTGKPAMAVAAGFDIDHRSRNLLNAKNVRFYQITDKMFDPR